MIVASLLACAPHSESHGTTTGGLEPGAGAVWWLRGTDLLAGGGLEDAIAVTRGASDGDGIGRPIEPLGDLGGSGRSSWWIGAYRGSRGYVVEATDGALGDEDPGVVGCSCWPVGDLDGDGIVDLAGDVDDRVLVFAGASLGRLTASDAIATLDPPARLSNYAAVRVGDVDGDGLDDIGVNTIVPLPDTGGTEPPGGVARSYVLAGPLVGELDVADAIVTFDGVGLSMGLDADGDGRSDPVEVVDRAWEGRSHVLVFDAEASLAAGVVTAADAVARIERTPDERIGVQFGRLDVDGDGAEDLAVAANGAVAPFDAAVFLGRSLVGAPTVPDLAFRWPDPTPGVRAAVVTGGDLDGDGLDELVVTGARASDTPDPREVLVFTGAGLTGSFGPERAAARLVSGTFQFATGAATGDADGDGLDDLAIGDPYALADAQER